MADEEKTLLPAERLLDTAAVEELGLLQGRSVLPAKLPNFRHPSPWSARAEMHSGFGRSAAVRDNVGTDVRGMVDSIGATGGTGTTGGTGAGIDAGISGCVEEDAAAGSKVVAPRSCAALEALIERLFGLAS